MSLSSLPTEPLTQISTKFACVQAFQALFLLNRRFYALFEPALYRTDAKGPFPKAIRWASKHGNIKTIMKSLSHGATIPPLQASSAGNRGPKTLFRGGMTSYYFFEETPNHHPLCVAVENGHTDIVEFLVKYGSIHEHTDMVQTLFNLGAQQNIQHCFKDNSPIQISSYKGNQKIDQKIDQKIVEILVNHSPETNRPTRQQMQAALECALLEHHLHIVTLLLQSGVDLGFYFERREPKSCCPPLIWAVEEGQMGLARLFLDKGADPSHPYGRAEPPLLRAVAKHKEDMVRLFGPLTHRIQMTRALSLSMTYPDGRIALALLENGAAPDFEDNDKKELDEFRGPSAFLMGLTLQLVPSIIRAISAGHKSLVNLLIEHGANVNGGWCGSIENGGPDLYYGGPLQFAMSVGNEDIVQVLRDHGADEEGKTFLNGCLAEGERFARRPYKPPAAG